MTEQPGLDRGQHLRRLLLAAMFAAMGTLLSFPPLAIPVAGTKLLPFQHTINAVAGILLGPWYAAGAALVTAALRNSLGWGTLFAFPGSPFGALVVGYAYRLLRRDEAALFEPLGTGPIGATLAALVVAPLMGKHLTLWTLQLLFLASSIPGAILGYVVIRVLRRVPAVGDLATQSR
jgi:energy coupling factor transporter S component ThiW